MYLLPYLNFRCEKCKRVYLPPLCNPCLVERFCFNLVVESRDEILFKGGRP
jgi:hypothetical protein